MMEVRIRVPDKEKKAVRDIMKELFHISFASEDEDMVMDKFMNYSQELIGDLKSLSVRYESTAYPGKKVVRNGIKFLQDITQIEQPAEFYSTVTKRQDDLQKFNDAYSKVLDEQLAPVKDSIAASQKRVFEVLDAKEYKDRKFTCGLSA